MLRYALYFSSCATRCSARRTRKSIAKFLFFLFLIVFLITLIAGLARRGV
jgi:hypothetical protein